jgi:hypothetical protein
VRSQKFCPARADGRKCKADGDITQQRSLSIQKTLNICNYRHLSTKSGNNFSYVTSRMSSLHESHVPNTHAILANTSSRSYQMAAPFEKRLRCKLTKKSYTSLFLHAIKINTSFLTDPKNEFRFHGKGKHRNSLLPFLILSMKNYLS